MKIKSNQSGLAHVFIVALVVLAISVVGLAGWKVWESKGKANGDVAQTSNVSPNNQKENAQSKNKAVIPAGWSKKETKIGNIYFPDSEGEISLKRQTDVNNTNGGYMASLKTYDLHIFELTNPVIQYRGGFFNPCKYDVKDNTLSKTTVKTENGEEYASDDTSCRSEKIVIAGKTLVDFSYVYEARYKAGLLIANKEKDFALLISKKHYDDTACYMDEKDKKLCEEAFTNNKTELKGFVEQLIKANPEVF